MYPLISVIVPVYNAENYLDKCIESLLEQTYQNLQLILVDDGSPDRCPAICDRYATVDARIQVIHKENGGVSSARNVGLDNADGKYVCFVDSDDIVPANGIMELYDGMSLNDSQYVAGICAILHNKKVKNPIATDRLIQYSETPNSLLDYIVQPGSYSPYAKMFITAIINENNIRFDENLKCSEDALFIRQYLAFCTSIRMVAKVVYRYNADNDHSLSKKRYPDFCEYYEKKLIALRELVSRLPLSAEEQSIFLSDRAIHGLYISFRHYISNWNEETLQKGFMEKSIKLLKPWIQFEKQNKMMNRSLKKWWKNKAKLVAEDHYDSLFFILVKEKKKSDLIAGMKRSVRSVLK